MRQSHRLLVTSAVVLTILTISATPLAAVLSVGPSGAQYTTVNAAVTAHNAGDTIELRGGPALYRLSAAIWLRAGALLRSVSTSRDTIEGEFAEVIRFAGNGVRLENLVVRYPATASTSSLCYMINGDNTGGHRIVNCYFRKNGGTLSRRGIRLNRDNSSVITAPTRIARCQFDTLSPIGASARSWDNLVTHVTIDSCVMNCSRVMFGTGFRLRYSSVRGAFDETVAGSENMVSGDSVLVEYTLFNPGHYGGGEYLTWDENDTKPYSVGSIVRYCVFDSCNHVPILIDGCHHFQVYGNTFIERDVAHTYGYALYCHQTDRADSNAFVQIHHNTFGANPLINRIRGSTSNGSTDFAFRLNLMTTATGDNPGNTYSHDVVRDTIDRCVYAATNPIISGFDVTGQIRLAITGAVLSNARYPFLKRAANVFFGQDRAGARGYLIDFAGPPHAVLRTGFCVDDTINELFWYADPVARDSGVTTLQVSTSATGPWTNAAVSPLRKAGSRSTLTAGNLTGGTFYYRLVFRGTAQSGFCADTTDVQSVDLTATATGRQPRDKAALGVERVQGTSNTFRISLPQGCSHGLSVAFYSTDGRTILHTRIPTGRARATRIVVPGKHACVIVGISGLDGASSVKWFVR